MFACNVHCDLCSSKVWTRNKQSLSMHHPLHEIIETGHLGLVYRLYHKSFSLPSRLRPSQSSIQIRSLNERSHLSPGHAMAGSQQIRQRMARRKRRFGIAVIKKQINCALCRREATAIRCHRPWSGISTHRFSFFRKPNQNQCTVRLSCLGSIWWT
ncbi:hypothetical protein BC629DRAFT_934162 [Irpex lacteus]|nr:hypothetical protein BC629DRAFT_934162 [Irpex lacteus]